MMRGLGNRRSPASATLKAAAFAFDAIVSSCRKNADTFNRLHLSLKTVILVLEGSQTWSRGYKLLPTGPFAAVISMTIRFHLRP